MSRLITSSTPSQTLFATQLVRTGDMWYYHVSELTLVLYYMHYGTRRCLSSPQPSPPCPPNAGGAQITLLGRKKQGNQGLLGSHFAPTCSCWPEAPEPNFWDNTRPINLASCLPSRLQKA